MLLSRATDADLLDLVLATSAGPGLGRAVLARCGGLRGLVGSSVRELATLPNVGRARALRVLASVELGRRVASRRIDTGQPLRSSADVHTLLAPGLAPLDREIFVALALDVRARLVQEHRIAQGAMEECTVVPRDVFRPLVRGRAATCILAHNHPSGDPSPSEHDRLLTMRMAEAGRMLGVRVIDHVIVASGGWYSFRDEGML